jgi:hypothetical protein
MGETFTAKLVLDTATATSQANAVDNKANQAIKKIETAKTRLSTYFEWGMHMANIWANYIARNMEGLEMAQRMQIIQQGLQIGSAEMSILLTTKRGISDIATGTPAGIAAGIFQLSLAASMQYILIDMQLQRRNMEAQMREQQQARAFFAAYR